MLLLLCLLGGAAAPDLSDYVGRFGLASDPNATIEVAIAGDHLTVTPALWSGRVVLERVVADSFTAVQYRRPTFAFRRDAAGKVVGVAAYSLGRDGVYTRRATSQPTPIELVIGHAPRDARRALIAAGADSAPSRAAALAAVLLDRPSLTNDLVDLLVPFSRSPNASAPVYATLGQALLRGNRRSDARQAFARAVALASSDSVSKEAIARLDGTAATAGGWQLPYSLDALFAPPSPSEIAAARAEWHERDLSVRDVRVVRVDTIAVGALRAEARTIGHLVHGQRHLGLVVVPLARRNGCCPVVVEAKGTSWNFPPLRIPGDLTSPWVLEQNANDVIYLVPGFRGEAIRIANDSLRSDGNPRNAWDGATDDLIAFLHAAASVTPEADTSRVCVFGRSRGGTVAQLAAIRDSTIDCVVSWASPADWFRLMGTGGWTREEDVALGLSRRSAPNEVGGQFIDVFLRPSIDDHETLADARRRLIQSSPLFFADRVPLIQAHWSLDDPSVPISNGRAMSAAWKKRQATGCADVRLHPRAGHDQDRLNAPAWSRTFLLNALQLPEAAVARCKPVAR